jgi:hypothetical protein
MSHLSSKLSMARKLKNEKHLARHWWLTSIIPAIWEAEFGRISVQGQPRQIVLQTSSAK